MAHELNWRTETQLYLKSSLVKQTSGAHFWTVYLQVPAAVVVLGKLTFLT